MNHFKEICRSSKSSVVHNIEKDADQERETDIEMENIYSVRFNSNYSAKIANLETSSNKVIITVPYKDDMGSDGYIKPFYIYKKYFIGQPQSNWQQQRIKNQTKNVLPNNSNTTGDMQSKVKT